MEVWKDIPDYEGRYQASTLGRVRGLERISRGRQIKGKIFKGHRGDKQGHLVVRLDDRKQHYIHRLVMLTFYRKAEEGEVVRHLNGIPWDNRFENLAYGTQSENNIDVYMYGKKFHRFDLSEVRIIKEQLLRGATQKSLAEKYDVSVRCINRINTGRTFGWIDTL